MDLTVAATQSTDVDEKSSQLNTTNYTRTLWNRDSYRIPRGSNLYGSHPVYYDHRGDNGTHAVFLLNSNGMNLPMCLTGHYGDVRAAIFAVADTPY